MNGTLRRDSKHWAQATTLFLFAGILILAALPAGATIKGRVINSSVNQPSEGDDVVLYRVDRTMHEMGRTKSDARGGFRFEAAGSFRYLVAVFHQKVSYHSKVLSSVDPAEVSVYNATPTSGNSLEASETLFPQVEGSSLKVTEFFVLSNQAMPPRTLTGARTFGFLLPKDATLDSTAVQPPGTLPLLVPAVPCNSRGQFCIAYPIRPGTTRIRAIYHLPYSGSISITKRLLHPVGQVSVMVPAALQFQTESPAAFAANGTQDGLTRYIAANIRPRQAVTFSLMGSGPQPSGKTSVTQSVPPPTPLHLTASSSVPQAQPRGLDRLTWAGLAASLGCSLFLFFLARRSSMRVASQPVQSQRPC